jgi:hypothetical protein
MIQDGKLKGFAMGHAIPVRTDYTAGEVRRFAQRAKDATQARRLLAIAAVLEGASREEAAKMAAWIVRRCGTGWIRFNEQGADGLINIPSPGMPPKLNAIHKAFLARIVEEGPIATLLLRLEKRSISRGKSCPSPAAIGQAQVTQSEDWYYWLLH